MMDGGPTLGNVIKKDYFQEILVIIYSLQNLYQDNKIKNRIMMVY